MHFPKLPKGYDGQFRMPNTPNKGLFHQKMESQALSAQLKYIHDDTPGISRRRQGDSFQYRRANGTTVKDVSTLKHIKSLALPPAWEDVWISPDKNSHLQATGRDNKGRKQYRYHPAWNQIRNETKYSHMLDFGMRLPRIRRCVARDMRRKKLSKGKVLATVVYLLEKTMIRVGNETYARNNQSYGLTTLRSKHVDVHGSYIHITFKGKSHVLHDIDIQDRKLASIINKLMDLPGYELFQYLDNDGNRQRIHAQDVNDYLFELSGKRFTAKDFRTWFGTVFAAKELMSAKYDEAAKKNVIRAIEKTAQHLRNTPTICKKCYIHPLLIEQYLAGQLRFAPNLSFNQVEKYILRLLRSHQSVLVSP